MAPLSVSQNKQNTVKTIDNLVNQILGQEATRVFYKYLESNYRVQRHEIVEKLDSFNNALEDYLGAGAAILENLIIQNLGV